MSLLERFREDSDFSADGNFTIDRARAQVKMSRYQLAQLDDFVLLTVQALVAAGSSAIDLKTEPNGECGLSVTIRGEGVTLDEKRLANVEDEIFGQSTGSASYRLLAVVLNAVAPFCEQAPKMELQEDSFLLVARLKLSLPGLLGEIENRVLFCQCPVTLNGRPLLQRDIEEEPFQVLRERESRVGLVSYGVLVETKLVDAAPGYQGFVMRNDFLLDASCSHVVENEVLFEAIVEAEEKARESLAAICAKQHLEDEEASLVLRWLPAAKGKTGLISLWRARVFPPAFASERLDGLTLLRNKTTRGRVLYSTEPIPLDLDEPVVLAADLEVWSCLQSLFEREGVLRHAKPYVESKLRTIHNKAEWEKRDRPTRLPPGGYIVKKAFRGEHWQGVVGLSGPPGGSSVVDILYQGRLLFSETLTGSYPPGIQAVINFDRAQVDAEWSRLEGADFVQGWSELELAIGEVFEGLGPIPSDQLYPGMRRYLLDCLTRRFQDIPAPALQTPLFELANGGGMVSAEELRRHRKVYQGPSYEPLSGNFPQELFLQPCVIPGQDTSAALASLLGGKFDTQSLSREFYRRIDEQLLSPAKPVLKGDGYLLRRSLDLGEVVGEIALTGSEQEGASLDCYYRGVLVQEGRGLRAPTRVLGGVAAIESALWKPRANWREIALDQGYDETMRLLEEQFRELEIRSIASESLSSGVRIKLLLAYPQEISAHRDLPLLVSSDGRRTLTLNEVQRALDRDGAIFVDDSGHWSGERVALAPPTPVERSLLKLVFGSELKLESVQAQLEKEERKRSFLAQQAVASPRLPDSYLFECRVKSREGVLGFGRRGPGETGQIVCYVEGRQAVVKSDCLPQGFTAALEFEKQDLFSDYSDVVIMPTELDGLVSQCFELLLDGLESAGSQEGELALSALVSLSSWPGFPKVALGESSFLENHDGQRFSPRRILELCPFQVKFVPPDFELPVVSEGIVLRHSREVLERLFSHVLEEYRLLQDVQEAMALEHRRRIYLQGVEAAIPPELPGDLEMVEAGLRARLRVSDRSLLVGQEAGGEVLGYLQWTGFPVEGVVRGLKPSRFELENERPMARLDAESYRAFTGFVETCYLEWCKEKSKGSLSADDRRRALSILYHSARMLSSAPACTVSRIAHLLWNTPLFLRGDGTWISGAALATELEDSEANIGVAPSMHGCPPGAVVAAEGFTEYSILANVFGEQRLLRVPRLADYIAEAVPAVEAKDPAPELDTSESPESIPDQFSSEVGETWSLNPWKLVSSKFQAWKDKRESDPARLAEQQLLRELHSDLTNLLRPGQFDSAAEHFSSLDFGAWPLGPAFYRSLGGGQYRLNRLNSGVRWLINTEAEERSRHIGRLILLVHLVGEVNIVSDPFIDAFEDSFLLQLVGKLEQTVTPR